MVLLIGPVPSAASTQGELAWKGFFLGHGVLACLMCRRQSRLVPPQVYPFWIDLFAIGAPWVGPLFWDYEWRRKIKGKAAAGPVVRVYAIPGNQLAWHVLVILALTLQFIILLYF